MSLLVSCPVCGFLIAGPTAPPDRGELIERVVAVQCNRCETKLNVQLTITQRSPAADVITLVETSRA